MALRHCVQAWERGCGLEGTTAPEVRGQGKEAGPPPEGISFVFIYECRVGWRLGNCPKDQSLAANHGPQFGEANAIVVSISWSFCFACGRMAHLALSQSCGSH